MDIQTTSIYSKADLNIKRKALEKIGDNVSPRVPDWTSDNNLLKFLSGVSALVKYPLHIVVVFFPCYFVHCNCFANYSLLNSSEKQLTPVF